MGRFFDEVINSNWFETQPQKDKDKILALHVFDVTNVANYFIENEKFDYQEKGFHTKFFSEWKASDFPTVLLPYNPVFIEFRSPKKSFFTFEKAGTLIHQNRLDDNSLQTSIAIMTNEREIEPFALVNIFSDEKGNPKEKTSGKILNSMFFERINNQKDWVNFRESKEDYIQEILNIYTNLVVKPILLSISLMNCKNVKAEENNPPKKVNKKRHKKGKKPLVRYHVLEIEPMKKVLKSEGDVQKNGLKKALHLCRGHFKDYRHGKGLFGKYKDIYWWEPHVRGDQKEGIVNKDYKLKEVKAESYGR